MENGTIVLTAGTMAVLLIEAVKWIIRLATKNPGYNFPAKVYVITIPIIAYAVQPLLAWLGVADYSLPTNWELWGKQLILVALSSVLAIIEYQAGVKSLSDYGKARIENSKPVEQ